MWLKGILAEPKVDAAEGDISAAVGYIDGTKCTLSNRDGSDVVPMKRPVDMEVGLRRKPRKSATPGVQARIGESGQSMSPYRSTEGYETERQR